MPILEKSVLVSGLRGAVGTEQWPEGCGTKGGALKGGALKGGGFIGWGPRRGPGGWGVGPKADRRSTRQPESPHVLMSGSRPSKTRPKFHEKTPREGIKKENYTGKRKKREIWGSPVQGEGVRRRGGRGPAEEGSGGGEKKKKIGKEKIKRKKKKKRKRAKKQRTKKKEKKKEQTKNKKKKTQINLQLQIQLQV